MYTDRPISGETVDTGVDTAASPSTSVATSSAPGAAHPSTSAGETAGRRSYLDPRSTTERLRLLWSTGARDVTLVAPRDTPRLHAIDPRGWIA